MIANLQNEYRCPLLEDLLGAMRREVALIPRPSALRRALFSPATRHELDSVEATIDTALAAPPSLDALRALEAARTRLRDILVRSDDEAQRAQTREQVLAAPPPAAPYYTLFKRTFSLANVYPLVPHARVHGAAMLAQLDSGGSRLLLTAHGVRLYGFFTIRKAVECRLRIAAPRGPEFSVVPRGPLSPRNTLPIASDFDARMLVFGQMAVAQSILDASLRSQLLTMRHPLRALVVRDGRIEVVWTQPLPPAGEELPREFEIQLITSIAKRLREA